MFDITQAEAETQRATTPEKDTVDTSDMVAIAEFIALERAEIRSRLWASLSARGAVDRERLRWIAAAERTEIYRQDGYRNTAEMLSSLFQISNWKARRWVQAAVALEHLPVTGAALESGALSLDKTVELARFARPADEAGLVRWAQRTTVKGVRQKADELQRKALDEVRTAHEARSVKWWFTDDELMLEGRFPAADGAALAEVVDRLARELPPEPEPAASGSTDGHDGRHGSPDSSCADHIPGWERSLADPDEVPRSLEQRRADALILLATWGSDSAGKSAGSQQPLLMLHADAATLGQGEVGCRTTGGRVLHPETARRLACDARLQVILEGEQRRPLGIGRVSQIAPPWLRRQVFDRDGNTCKFPGCEMRRFLHPHHIQHWCREGPTDLDNLLTVCTTHHSLLHEGNWSVALGGDGEATWFRPDGTRFVTDVDPPEGIPSPEPPEPTWAEAAAYCRMFDLAGVI